MADEVFEKLGPGVALVNAVFGEDLIGKVGAGFEGEFFGEDEGVVTVEEDMCDLVQVESVRGIENRNSEEAILWAL